MDDRWRHVDPDEWTATDVLDFIYSLDDVSAETVYGERFSDVTGFQLCRLEEHEFTRLDPHHGHIIYHRLHSLIAQRSCLSDLNADGRRSIPNSSITNDNNHHLHQLQQLQIPQSVQNLVDDDCSVGDGCSVGEDQMKWSDDNCVTTDNLSLSSHSPLQQQRRLLLSDLQALQQAHGRARSQRVNQQRPAASTLASVESRQRAVKRRRQRYSDESSRGPHTAFNSDTQRHRPSATNTHKTGRTGSHLWEFLRRLLTWSSSQSEASERVIEWQNRSEGVFRIVNSSAVARLWGEQKHNRRSVMTYEKLSRALRWCRSEKFLSPIPKDSGYPRKLCFQFGPKALNWRDDMCGYEYRTDPPLL